MQFAKDHRIHAVKSIEPTPSIASAPLSPTVRRILAAADVPVRAVTVAELDERLAAAAVPTSKRLEVKTAMRHAKLLL